MNSLLVDRGMQEMPISIQECTAKFACMMCIIVVYDVYNS